MGRTVYSDCAVAIRELDDGTYAVFERWHGRMIKRHTARTLMGAYFAAGKTGSFPAAIQAAMMRHQARGDL